MRRRRRFTLLLFASAVCATLASSVAIAAVPNIMSYSGELQTASGAPLATGTYQITFSLYSVPQGGTPIWSETHAVEVTDGRFHTVLGRTGPAALIGIPFDRAYYLGVSVGADPEMTPRQPLATLPYAFRAGLADRVADGSITADKIAPLAVTNDKIQSVSWSKLTGIPTDLVAPPSATATGPTDGVPAKVWSLKGNEGSAPPDQFLGTTDAQPLVIKVNNAVMMNFAVGGPISVMTSFEVGGDLDVGGKLGVQGATVLHNTVDVTGATTLQSTLGVGGATALQGTLDVGDNALFKTRAGVGTIAPSTTFNIAAPPSDTYPLRVSVTGTSNQFSVNQDGQVFARSTKAGPAGDSGDYGMLLDAQNQGLFIRLNDKTYPDGDNHYVTFAGSDNAMRGRIEGQTPAELHSSFDYIWFHSMAAIGDALSIAMVVVDLLGFDDFDAAVVDALELVTNVAEWGKQWNDMESNIGITYESGSGDYAEWLRKENPGEPYSFGDIVGVKGGVISRNTGAADHYLVVSMSPIVLGNMPPKGQEADYEKVAFMGQVPVKVKGRVNVGDYIIPSGSNDGLGIAVPKSGMSDEQYTRIVGVAWSSGNAGTAYSLVNVAIGLTSSIAVDRIASQQREIDALKNSINTIVSFMKAKDPSFEAPEPLSVEGKGDRKPGPRGTGVQTIREPVEPPAETDLHSVDDVRRMLRHNLPIVTDALTMARKSLEEKGINVDLYPQVKRLLTDPSFFAESFGKDPASFKSTR